VTPACVCMTCSSSPLYKYPYLWYAPLTPTFQFRQCQEQSLLYKTTLGYIDAGAGQPLIRIQFTLGFLSGSHAAHELRDRFITAQIVLYNIATQILAYVGAVQSFKFREGISIPIKGFVGVLFV
jgi:hypothetical protein